MKKTLWNDNWKFWPEGDAFALMWSVDPSAVTVTLPHDAMIFTEAKPDSLNESNTGYRDGGVYHYSKILSPKAEDRDKTFIIHFEGIYQNAQIYVNSECVCHQPYGYTGFYVKLNDFLHFGEDNEIRVIVRNSGMPNSRWYSGSGIYRDVYLLTSEKTYLRPDGCFITTESVEEDGIAVIRVENTIVNRDVNRKSVMINRIVKDPTGKVVAAEESPVTLFEGEETSYSMRIAIEKPKLWSAEFPALYTLETAVVADGTVIDSDTQTFGIRTLSLDAKRGLRVNGRSVKLAGACIHHDNGLIGAATYYDFHYRQVKKLKEAGFNAIRMSHHPAAPALLRACDELGMYIMDEAFDMWTRCKTANDYALHFMKNWESDVEAMARKDYNHPSVVLYSVGNEIPEIGTPIGAAYADKIAKKLRSIDPTRYITAGINALFAAGMDLPKVLSDVMEEHKDELANFKTPDGNVNEFMATMAFEDDILNHPVITGMLEQKAAVLDILGYNYMTCRYEKDAKNYQNGVFVGSETYPSAISKNWRLVKKYPNILGDFVWTGWDYIGEAGIGVPSYDGTGDGFHTPYPCAMAYTGDYDITGFLKPAGYLSEIVLGARKNPYVITQDPAHFGQRVNMTPWSTTECLETWTYPGYEGKPVKVEVFSAGDEVELLVNGKSVGRKPAGEEVGHRIFFETVYEPGEISAITYEKGQEIGRFTVHTCMKDTSLMMNVEHGITGKLAYINIENVDERGTIDYNKVITIEAECPDAEIYVGSGNHSPIYNYAGSKTETYNGRAQVAVIKKNAKDTVVVTVNGKLITV